MPSVIIPGYTRIIIGYSQGQSLNSAVYFEVDGPGCCFCNCIPSHLSVFNLVVKVMDQASAYSEFKASALGCSVNPIKTKTPTKPQNSNLTLDSLY